MSELPGSVPDDLCGTASADAEVCGQQRRASRAGAMLPHHAVAFWLLVVFAVSSYCCFVAMVVMR